MLINFISYSFRIEAEKIYSCDMDFQAVAEQTKEKSQINFHNRLIVSEEITQIHASRRAIQSIIGR